MKTKVIYLQSSFWKQLQSDTSIAGLQCMMNVYEAVSDSNLRTDIEDDVTEEAEFPEYTAPEKTENITEELQILLDNRAKKLMDTLHNITTPDGNSVNASIGIYVYDGKENISVEDMIVRADTALYTAKNSGKAKYSFYK